MNGNRRSRSGAALTVPQLPADNISGRKVIDGAVGMLAEIDSGNVAILEMQGSGFAGVSKFPAVDDSAGKAGPVDLQSNCLASCAFRAVTRGSE